MKTSSQFGDSIWLAFLLISVSSLLIICSSLLRGSVPRTYCLARSLLDDVSTLLQVRLLRHGKEEREVLQGEGKEGVRILGETEIGEDQTVL